MNLKKWNITFIVTIIVILISLFSMFIFFTMNYHYHTYKPSPSRGIGIAVDSRNDIHLTWYFYQILDGGHDMVGIWYMKLDQDGNIIKDKTRIIDDFAEDPKMAIDKNDTIHIIWRKHDSVFKRPYGEYNAICYHYDINLNFIEKYNLDKFYNNMTAIEIIKLNKYKFEFKNNSSGMALNPSRSQLIFPPNPVYVIDLMGNKHIVNSTNDDIYYTKIDSSGKEIISDKKLDCVPECYSINILCYTTYISVPVMIILLIIWKVGIILIKRKKEK